MTRLNRFHQFEECIIVMLILQEVVRWHTCKTLLKELAVLKAYQFPQMVGREDQNKNLKFKILVIMFNESCFLVI